MSGEHLTDSQIAGYLDHDLPLGDRAVVEAHLAGCSDCREATADVSRLARAYRPEISVPQLGPARRRNGKRVALLAGGAIAASFLILSLSLNGKWTAVPTPVRATSAAIPDARPMVHVTGPTEDVTDDPRELIFSWRATGASLYRLSVFDETGAPVLVRETADTVVTLTTAPDIVPGDLYLWRVDAIADGLTASSGVRKLRLAR